MAVFYDALTKSQEIKADLWDWLGNWQSCLLKLFAQDPNRTEQHGLVILVSDVIGSFVNKGAVVQTDKEPDWQVNEEEEVVEVEWMEGVKTTCLVILYFYLKLCSDWWYFFY